MSSEVETSLDYARFDSLTARSLSLRPSRLCRGFPSRSVLAFARNDTWASGRMRGTVAKASAVLDVDFHLWPESL